MMIRVAGAPPPEAVKDGLNSRLPAGVRVTVVEALRAGAKSPQVKESRFRITVPAMVLENGQVDAFIGAEHFHVVKTDKKGQHKIDIRALVKTMDLVAPDEMDITIAHIAGPTLKPAEIVARAFNLDPAVTEGLRVLKTGQTLKES